MRKDRLSRVLEAMERQGLDQLLVSDPTHIDYLTGYRPDPGERMIVLRLTKDGDCALYANELFPVPDLGIPVHPHSDIQNPIRLLSKDIRSGTLGVDGSWQGRFILPLLSLLSSDTKTVLGSLPLQEVRMQKEPEELELLREASRRNDAVMEDFLSGLREGIREDEATEILATLYRRHGLPAPAFAIVSFGRNAADPHHAGGHDALLRGQCAVADIGSPYRGYHSDMTRTVFCGEAGEEERRVYDLVLRAHLAAIEKTAPGVPLREIDRAARSIIENGGYGDRFTHRTGHNIGLDVHEYPDVSAVSEVAAQPGMVFSIEPGIYLPGRFGVRIENLVEVTEDGCVSLNACPRELRLV